MKRRKSREFSLQTILQQEGRGKQGKHSLLMDTRREAEGNAEVGMRKSSLVKNQMAKVKIQTYGPCDLGKITLLPHFHFLSLKMRAHRDALFPGGCCRDSMRCRLGGAAHSAQRATRCSTGGPSISGEEDRRLQYSQRSSNETQTSKTGRETLRPTRKTMLQFDIRSLRTGSQQFVSWPTTSSS